MSLGGGGASAPSTPEPMTAPGVFRPDWPSPKYAQLPWQRQLEVAEDYADRLIRGNRRERGEPMNSIIDCLSNYTNGKKLNESQLTAALTMMNEHATHEELWLAACNVDRAPVRGKPTEFTIYDADEMLTKFRLITKR